MTVLLLSVLPRFDDSNVSPDMDSCNVNFSRSAYTRLHTTKSQIYSSGFGLKITLW